MKHHQITASMAKDIAFKLGAVLDDEEAEIFADGYNVGLLLCPFCGSPAEHYPDGDMEGYIIMCGNKNGDCNLQTFGFTTPEEAEKAWNTRAAIPQTGNFRENPISSTNNFRKIADTSTNSPVTQDGWISCNERMPDNDESKPIAIFTGKCLGQGMFVATYDDDGFFDYWEGMEIIGVTHWMPLPEPPQK